MTNLSPKLEESGQSPLDEFLPDSPAPSHSLPQKQKWYRLNIWRWLGGALSLTIISVALYLLWQVLREVDYTKVRAIIAATPWGVIFLSGLFTATSYLALTFYDTLVLRQMQTKISYSTIALASFLSSAISFTLGFTIIIGSALRYFVYRERGLRADDLARLTVLTTIAFWMGMGFVLGLGLALKAELFSTIDDLPVLVNRGLGLAIMVLIITYLTFGAKLAGQFAKFGISLPVPGLGISLLQLVCAVCDIGSAAAALFVLLPSNPTIDTIGFGAAYAFAVILGGASSSPGGLGVFELTMLKLNGFAPEAMIAALFLFRIIYFFLPFCLALFVFILLLAKRLIWRRKSA